MHVKKIVPLSMNDNMTCSIRVGIGESCESESKLVVRGIVDAVEALKECESINEVKTLSTV
jgi:hypothetical protein